MDFFFLLFFGWGFFFPFSFFFRILFDAVVQEEQHFGQRCLHRFYKPVMEQTQTWGNSTLLLKQLLASSTVVQIALEKVMGEKTHLGKDLARGSPSELFFSCH